ncbi:uncharacterized protein LOC141668265 isoform X2 [Apium graveolens]|uniref:uncharacterized protein LOC141668265 isoform X2 n=1 Tax=Apium graveolens TaxID=4045 RepID=UPI003D78BCF4
MDVSKRASLLRMCSPGPRGYKIEFSPRNTVSEADDANWVQISKPFNREHYSFSRRGDALKWDVSGQNMWVSSTRR